MEKVILSEAKEFESKAFKIVVYQLSGAKLLELAPKVSEFEKLQNSKDLEKVVTACMELVFEIIKEDNPTITVADLLKNVSLSGAVKIVHTAMGATL
jgi:hypothetical protein